jgi:hypothetical protein
MFSKIKKVIRKDVSKKEQADWEKKCSEVWDKARVLVGIPNSGSVDDMLGESPFKSFLHLAMFMASNKESTNWGIQPIPRMITHEARNALAKQAIDQGYTHICMIDSDQVFDKDIVHRLLLWRKEIVGVRAYRRTSPHYPCVFIKKEGLPDTEAMVPVNVVDKGLLITDAIGFGLILISVEVFKKITYPYFYFSKTGEDINFCREAREAGFKVYVDTDVEIGHVTTTIIREKEYLEKLNDGTVGQFDKDMLQLIQEQKGDKNVNFGKIKK